MQRALFITASLFAALGIIIGAFGAHALKGMLSPEQQGWFQTAVHYHQISALAALFMALMADKTRAPDALNGWILLAGAAIFSLSLYTMSLGGPRWLGAVTPIGGTLMILAWCRLSWQFYRSNSNE